MKTLIFLIVEVLVGAFDKERAFSRQEHCENFWCGDGECPSSPAGCGCGQVCGGSVSSVLRTVAASPEQSTSLAMVPGTELGTLLVTWPHHCCW